MTQRPMIVFSVAGLSPSLLRSGDCPAIERFASRTGWAAVKPVLPALTLPMQATLTTGVLPGRHGVVGNGYFDRTTLEHRFWCASTGLVDSARAWDRSGRTKPRVAALFWWNFLGAKIDLYLNVAPFHMADGSTVSSCASKPAHLYARLEERFGPFPLHRFWGPAISIESSRWIVDATLEVAAQGASDLILSYVPHMDYSLQRSGPGSNEARRHLAELDSLLSPVIDRAMNNEFELVLLSEYGISPVSEPVQLNRLLRNEGLFAIRPHGGREYPDLAGSRAFAICDHQIAHIYLSDRGESSAVESFLQSAPGVATVLDRAAQKLAGIDHPRSGDLVALAGRNAWFDYSWWNDQGAAPDYARTVDIHRKIGYDPLELIPGRDKKGICMEPSRIKGSHGLIPDRSDEWALIVTSFPDDLYSAPPREVAAIDVATLLMNNLERLMQAN